MNKKNQTLYARWSNTQNQSPEELAELILLHIRNRLSETELVGMHSIDYQEGFWDCYNQMLKMLDVPIDTK